MKIASFFFFFFLFDVDHQFVDFPRKIPFTLTRLYEQIATRRTLVYILGLDE